MKKGLTNQLKEMSELAQYSLQDLHVLNSEEGDNALNEMDSQIMPKEGKDISPILAPNLPSENDYSDQSILQDLEQKIRNTYTIVSDQTSCSKEGEVGRISFEKCNQPTSSSFLGPNNSAASGFSAERIEPQSLSEQRKSMMQYQNIPEVSSQRIVHKHSDDSNISALLGEAGVFCDMEKKEPKQHFGQASRRLESEWGKFEWKSLLPQSHRIQEPSKKSCVIVDMNRADNTLIFPHKIVGFLPDEYATRESSPTAVPEKATPKKRQVTLKFTRPNTSYRTSCGTQVVSACSSRYLHTPKTRAIKSSTCFSVRESPIVDRQKRLGNYSRNIKKPDEFNLKSSSTVQIGQELPQMECFVPKDASDPFGVRNLFKKVQS